jgi:O-acetyl-ADP-ribose deacetylase (regulator of RNase III)
MLTFVRGDLFQAQAQTLVNPVNLAGFMGKGLALQFKERYPEMYEEYRDLCDSGQFEMGDLHLHRGEDHWILNFPTKRHYRSKSRLEYIEIGLDVLKENYARWGITSIAMPALGCGLGGLRWSDVRATIVEHLDGLPISIEVYEPGHAPDQLAKDDDEPRQPRLL